MANPAYGYGAFSKSAMPSRLDGKRERAKQKLETWLKVCKQVDTRDHWKCRACGRPCSPTAIDFDKKGHRHHVTFRSKGGQDVAPNLVLICAVCHDRIHVKRTLRIEAGVYGADGPLLIWRTSPDGQEYLSRRETGVHRVEKD